jgi:uncharacterized protein YbjT (DUF2867 family)
VSRVLVAGATGALGRELVDALAERGHAVYAMARSTHDRRLEPHRRAISEVRVGDVTDPASLPAALDGAEIVVSTVGLTRPTHGVDFEDVDYRGNLALLDAAAAAGARRFVLVSLANLDDAAADHVPVVAAKRRFEAALRAGPVPWSIPRPSGFFWNYGVLLGQARSHGAVYLFGDGDAARRRSTRPIWRRRSPTVWSSSRRRTPSAGPRTSPTTTWRRSSSAPWTNRRRCTISRDRSSARA